MLGIKEGAGLTIFRQTVLSHSTEKLRRRTLLCCTKFLLTKKFVNKRGGREYQDFPSFFLFHSAEEFPSGTLNASIISGIENFMLLRRLSLFYVEFFLSHCTENFCRGILWCIISFGYRKLIGFKRGGFTFFP